MANITEYNLPIDAYASFDARSLRDLIVDRLNNNSDISFTDQNYEGSNLNAIIDIIAYSYHTLLFYLNQTSSEAVFTDTQLYENMNRIVKLIDYKPVGKQSSVVPIELTGLANLSIGYHTVPRFAFITSNGKTYSVVRDTTYRKITAAAEKLTPIENNLFYEGKFQEYPLVNATGEEYEMINLLPGADTIVDHFNIYVFVKEINNNKWYEYKRSPSLFLADANDRVFECRYNQNKNYEIRFGNNINGVSLTNGDQVAIYYLPSSGDTGKITKNNFNATTLNIFNTTRFDQIFNDIKDTTLDYVSVDESVNITATNTEDSTDFGEEESVEEIRTNAPKFFTSEYKLITKKDYEAFITRNYKNFVYDVKVHNNSDYLNSYRSYLTNNLGLNSYKGHNNALFNQVTYSDSFDFNNLFVTIVPKFKKGKSVVTRSNYISPSLKTEIIRNIRDYKLLNAEITFLDPIYLGIDFYLKSSSESRALQIKDYTSLVIERSSATIVNDNTIIDKAFNIIQSYFNNAKLGQFINITQLNADILGIDGVVGLYTYRSDLGIKADGINFGLYNPVYNGRDLKIINTNTNLLTFQIPFIENSVAMKNKITVETVTRTTNIEY